jgi:hypothetical protein
MMLLACSSVPDIHFDDVDGGPNGTDGGREGSVDPNCKPTGDEICDDGIDNDCDGRTDCQDRACTFGGFSCQDLASDWTPVAFAAGDRPGCRSGEQATDLKVAAGDGTAACTCSCTSAGTSCAAGSYTLSTANDGACSVTPATKDIPASSGNCAAIGSTLAVSARAKIDPPATPASCNAVQGVAGGLADGRMCQAARFGKGCGGNQVCAPKPMNGLGSCVTKPGKNACPFGFSKRVTAGTGATDTRSCNGCQCGVPSPCTGGSVSLFDNSQCKTNGNFQGAVGIGSSCNQLNPDNGFTATHFTSTPPTGGGCGTPTAQAMPTGTVAFADERTVCCR